MARRRKRKSSVFEIILLIILLGYFIYTDYFKESEAHVFSEVAGDNLVVEFVDVGEADAIFISDKGENMLIDAGNNEDGPLLVEYFKSKNIDSFKYVFGTHAHEDHIGGVNNIIDNFNIDKFFMPDVATTTKTFLEVLDSLENKGYYFDTPKIGDKFNLGNSIVEVVYIGDDEEDLNNSSIVLKIKHGNNSFLFMGDATSEVEKLILDKNIRANVLKVGHHGSKYSSSLAFLKKVNPDYAIIEVGENNIYNHPSKTILDRLNNLGTKIYRTDLNGTIIVKSDGNVLDIKTIKTKTDRR